VTVLAGDAEPGKLYRLTRDPGTTYYVICNAAAQRRLEKRLSRQNPRFMKADDRFALQTLERCQKDAHVLAMRVTRFLSEDGSRRETRAYVAFPPDYVLREVDKPPGYTRGKRNSSGAPASQKGLDTDAAREETLETEKDLELRGED
jgi:hypothetical protein